MDKFNFPVELVPVETQKTGILVPKKLAVIRIDTKQPIGLVSDKYELLKHDQVIKGFREALSKTKTTEKISLARDGAQMFATYTMSAMKFEVRKGDMVSLQLFVKNSYDGSNALQIALGAFRLVCSNGMVIGKRFFSFSQKHIGSKGNVEAEKLNAIIAQLSDSFKAVLPHMQQMARAKLATDPEKLFDQKKVRIPSYLLDIARAEYIADKEKTVWSYYNSLTSSITHSIKKESAQASLKYGKVVWDTAIGALK